MSQLTEWDFLRLHDHLSIAQAACCITGIQASRLGSNTSTDPYITELIDEASDEYAYSKCSFELAISALVNAVKMGRLNADKSYRGKYHHIRMVGDESEGYWEPVGDIDPWKTLIDVDDLKRWLINKQLRPKFFFAEQEQQAQYLDPSHPRHSYELAAAVRAWEAMEDDNLRKGKSSAKQALEEWLKSRYRELQLYHTKENEKNGTKPGDMNNSAISRVAVVANWNPDGGAPPTPGD